MQIGERVIAIDAADDPAAKSTFLEGADGRLAVLLAVLN
jgi:hypothetical protein